jgi:hypothetical protein
MILHPNLLMELVSKVDAMKFEIEGLKLDIERLQRTAPTICCCKDDWTDGGVYCQSCGLERK